jgi:hypothetical protein
VRITLDIPDPTPLSGADNQALPAPDQTAAPAPATVTAESDATPTFPPSRPPVAAKQPKPVEQPKVSEERTSQPAVSTSLHSFDRQGGVNDILDPNRGRPGFFKFEPPSAKEGA